MWIQLVRIVRSVVDIPRNAVTWLVIHLEKIDNLVDNAFLILVLPTEVCSRVSEYLYSLISIIHVLLFITVFSLEQFNPPDDYKMFSEI